jgi:hypothetical protein
MKPQRQLQGTPRKITSFHSDERLDWVADLACGHQQYVRHEPPWTDRHWVTTFEGRVAHIGLELNCLTCPPTEAVRRARVCQLFEARHPERRTETEVFLFFSWLQRSHSELLPTDRGDPYQHLRVDLKGLFS